MLSVMFFSDTLNVFEMVSFVPIFTGIAFVVACQVCRISVVSSVYFKLLLVY
jgi:hypothetical protein